MHGYGGKKLAESFRATYHHSASEFGGAAPGMLATDDAKTPQKQAVFVQLSVYPYIAGHASPKRLRNRGETAEGG